MDEARKIRIYQIGDALSLYLMGALLLGPLAYGLTYLSQGGSVMGSAVALGISYTSGIVLTYFDPLRLLYRLLFNESAPPHLHQGYTTKLILLRLMVGSCVGCALGFVLGMLNGPL